MDKKDLIPAALFCRHEAVEFSFVNSLKDIGLIEITRIENEDFISETELEKLERLSRIHYELEVNPEGIDVINHLLERIREMQAQINMLESQLKFYAQD